MPRAALAVTIHGGNPLNALHVLRSVLLAPEHTLNPCIAHAVPQDALTDFILVTAKAASVSPDLVIITDVKKLRPTIAPTAGVKSNRRLLQDDEEDSSITSTAAKIEVITTPKPTLEVKANIQPLTMDQAMSVRGTLGCVLRGRWASSVRVP